MSFVRSKLSLAIIATLTTSAFANENQTQTNNDDPLVSLNTIVVEADKNNEVGKTVYTQEELQKTPNSSKNITDFLKVNPNVQFDREQRSATTQGELRPAEISINGAQSYQNKFLINGVNNSNILDPGGALGSDSYQGFNTGSQGMAINTDLLCKLEVLDSNVSAEYGEFTGGVISAESCAPQTEVGKVHGTIIYDYTESDWARYNNVTPNDPSESEEPTDLNQKEFKKQGLSTSLYGRATENLGLNIYASTRQSLIPVKSGLADQYMIDQERNNTNIGSTFFYQASDNNKLKFGFDYGDIDALSYIESRRNSDSKSNTQSLAIFGELESRLSKSTVIQKLNYQKMDSQRVASDNRGIFWQYAEGSKDWIDTPTSSTAGVGEGTASGSLNQIQDSISYAVKSIIDPIKLGNTTHQWTAGAGYDHYNVKWERPEDVYLFNNTGRTNLSTTQACSVNDPLCDSAVTLNGKNGQYFFKGNLYKAGSTSTQQDKWNVYIQDQIKWGNWDARIGLRSDYESISSDYNLAPRTSLKYRPFGDDRLQIVSGFNRYYSAQTLATRLRQDIADLKYNIEREQKNPSSTTWKEIQDSGYTNNLSNLKTPYSDEMVFAITSQIRDWELGLKWVNRDSKDEITRDRYVSEQTLNGKVYFWGTDYFTYGNNGRSEADIFTLTLRNLQPLNFFSTSHQFALGADYSDIFKNFVDYSENFQANHPIDSEDRLVQYGGKIISWADRPAENFNQPWTARFSWDIGFENIPLKINNFFSYKSSYEDAIRVKDIEYNGEMIDAFEIEKIKPRFSWDMRTTYDFKAGQNKNAILGLTINNLTNRKNTYTSSNMNSNTLKSEIGRQFIADVTFKF